MALPAGFLYSGAAFSQLMHNGRFVLGNWGGMDFLGKVPLLSGRLPEASPFARLNSIVDELQPARDKLRLVNNPFLEALIAGQYYEYLRWFVIVPELQRSWPSWRAGDEYHRGQLAASLAISYVTADPIGFLRRTAVDLGRGPPSDLPPQHDRLKCRLNGRSFGAVPDLVGAAARTKSKAQRNDDQ